MSRPFITIYRQLLPLSNQFDAESGTKKKSLLAELQKSKLPDTKLLANYQHLLLFLSAHPYDTSFQHQVFSEMDRVARTMEKASKKNRQRLQNTGLPFTSTNASLTHDLLQILHAKKDLKLSYSSSEEDTIELNTILSFTLPGIEKDYTSAGCTQEELWETLGVKEKDRAPFLLSELTQLNHVPFIKDYLLDKFNLYVTIDPLSRHFSKLFNRIHTDSPYYHSDLLKKFDHEVLMNTPLPEPKHLSDTEKSEMIEVMQTSLCLLERETDPCTFIDRSSLRYYELERGISVAIFGMIPERQMSMESYVGYTLFKNGYPCAYGGGWVYGTRSLFGINIFEQFRGGESGYILIQLLRTYKQVFGLNYFEVEPYQYGLDNPEGIESGAFWFYYRYGFRPLDKTLGKLAKTESEKIKTKKNYRSSKKTLIRFTESNIGWLIEGRVPPRVTDLREKITRMITQNYAGNRPLAIQRCTDELKSKIPLEENLNKPEMAVLHDLALTIAAFEIKNSQKLDLVPQMIEMKPTDLYGWNKLLTEFLRLPS